MTSHHDAIIIGAGVGGMITALRLAARGRSVLVCERNATVGGKLAVYQRDGFTFDMGPSLLTLPAVFDDAFRLAGTTLADECDLIRLDPSFRYFWPDGSTVTFRDEPVATAEALESFSNGAGAEYLQYLERARTIWQVSERTFFAGDMHGRLSLLRRMRSPRDLSRIDARRTLHSRAEAQFRDPRLVQWLGRYATYSGSDPRQVPATLGCIAAVEADLGAWYVRGGLGALCSAIERVARRAGVEFRTNADVQRIIVQRNRAEGVVVDDEELHSDVVIANADAEHLYRDLAPDAKALRRVERAGRSTSGIAVVVGVAGRTPHIDHHNVWFSSDYAREFDDIAAGHVPRNPTIYGCVSSVTDPTQAPAGDENWFLLINVPPRDELQVTGAGEWMLAQLAKTGPDLRRRAKFVEVVGPADFARKVSAPGGAIYGTSSNGRSAAFRRPAIRSAVRGMYLVGGSTHPGGGLPLVAMSARITSDLVLRDFPSALQAQR
ncbi:MAG: phytoene desaturase [Actinobacteria bacterium]|nr:phytoene desaturase [Actinomycetota bacterium]